VVIPEIKQTRNTKIVFHSKKETVGTTDVKVLQAVSEHISATKGNNLALGMDKGIDTSRTGNLEGFGLGVRVLVVGNGRACHKKLAAHTIL
jgi:hypothetical protein